jgi:Putative restriction endonuclease
MPTFSETAFFELASDWLREVLSPSTEQMDRVDKLAIYAAQGVTHVWLVDPDARILEVLVLCDGHWELECVYKAADEIAPHLLRPSLQPGGAVPVTNLVQTTNSDPRATRVDTVALIWRVQVPSATRTCDPCISSIGWIIYTDVIAS